MMVYERKELGTPSPFNAEFTDNASPSSGYDRIDLFVKKIDAKALAYQGYNVTHHYGDTIDLVGDVDEFKLEKDGKEREFKMTRLHQAGDKIGEGERLLIELESKSGHWYMPNTRTSIEARTTDTLQQIQEKYDSFLTFLAQEVDKAPQAQMNRTGPSAPSPF